MAQTLHDLMFEYRAQQELLVDMMTKKELLTAEDAVKIPLLFKIWKPGTQATPADYPADGTIWRCPVDGHLYRVKEGMGHKSYGDPNFAPSLYNAAWEPVAEPGEDGSLKHPYTFVSGMAVTAGLYYKQGDLLCRCHRSEAWLYGTLAEQVPGYMEVVT